MTPEQATTELFELLDKRKYDEVIVKKINDCLLAGADPNFQESGYPNETPLARALSRKGEFRNQVIKLLIENKVGLNQEFDNKTPLAKASSTNDIDLVALLLSHGAIKGIDTAFTTAIEKDNIELVTLLLDNGVSLNAQEESFLISCIEPFRIRDRKKQYEVLPGLQIAQLLIDHGINFTETSILAAAVKAGFTELVELLIKNGYKITPENPILNWVESEQIAQLLIKEGASVNAKNKAYMDMTPLMSSIQNNNKKLITFFIKNGADLHAIDKHNNTAFHHIIYHENSNMLNELAPYFDVKKCNAIAPILPLSDEPHITKELNKLLNN